jgi:hypothetical protein
MKTIQPKPKQTISVQFRCGHFEILPRKEYKELTQTSAPFIINGKLRAESGLYCAECSKPKTHN